jgi:hypothetical protein
MSYKFTFPTFYFKPIKLNAAAEKIKRKYPSGDYLPEKMIHRKLPDLLAEIKALPTNKNIILEFARKLKTIDINILSSAYPYETEDEDTIEKIIFILSERYNNMVGRRFWNHFQHRIRDRKLNQILVLAFQKEDNSFLGLNKAVREKYQNVFTETDPDYILYHLALFIGRENYPVQTSFQTYKIEEDSRLANELWLLILELYIGLSGFVDREGEDSIVNSLKTLDKDRYKRIIFTYLDAYEYTEFHAKLFNQIIKKLKDPRIDERLWKDVSQIIIQKVRKYLNEKDLDAFFNRNDDYERFNYWKKYSGDIEWIKPVEEPPVLAMYYRDFVVVEFANTGNAAYFYEKEGFKKVLSHKMKPYVRENSLKDTKADYFITKLNHSGHWPSRYDQYMVNYLNGNFYYSHLL